MIASSRFHIIFTYRLHEHLCLKRSSSCDVKMTWNCVNSVENDIFTWMSHQYHKCVCLGRTYRFWLSKKLCNIRRLPLYLHFCGKSTVEKVLPLFKAMKRRHSLKHWYWQLEQNDCDWHTKHWRIWSIESWTHRHSKCTSTSMCPCRNFSFSLSPFQCVHMWLI